MVDSSDIRRQFSERLKKALDGVESVRKARGRNVDLHKAMVEKGSDVTVQATHKWLAGESTPDDANMARLAKWLGVSIEWLHYGNGDPGDRHHVDLPDGYESAGLVSRTYQADKYQSASPEHRKAVDDLADQLLDLTPEQAQKLKQAMELLMPKNESRKV